MSLGALVIEGELEKVEKFDGGTTNGPCDLDVDDSGVIDADEMGILNADCPDEGDAVVADVAGNGVGDDPETDAVDEGEDDTYTFTLTETARDANGDGVVDDKDFTIVVNNSRLERRSREPVRPGYYTPDG